jgi:hypothetical protein
MCSRSRGPAIWPSFVTWPTSTTAQPDSLAKRTRSAAELRNWLGDPGVEGIASLAIVWMESTTRQAGRSASAAASTSSTRVVASAATLPASARMRRARRLTCSSDSSPVAYRAPRGAASPAAAWSSSVDLPMPGSPPRSTTDPGTRPPPRARLSSARPVSMRGTCSAPTSASRRTGGAPAAGRPAGAAPGRASSSVFHAPQPGHWPCHFGVTAPHSAQAYWGVLRAIVTV